MSVGSKDAQRVFDAGVLSLGIPIDGLEVDRDVEYAGHGLQAGNRIRPGDVRRVARPRRRRRDHRRGGAPPLPDEQVRWAASSVGWVCPRAHSSGRFETGLYLDYTLRLVTEIRLAYVASLIQGKDYDEAEQILDELAALRAGAPDDSASDEICAYIRGILHFTTQRWPDVLTALANSASFVDAYIAAGAHLMVGLGVRADGAVR